MVSLVLLRAIKMYEYHTRGVRGDEDRIEIQEGTTDGVDDVYEANTVYNRGCS